MERCDGEGLACCRADRCGERLASAGGPGIRADQPLGTIRVRRVYGDFTGSAGSWTDAAARHALEHRHCDAPAKGKNGVDILLTIDAMRLLQKAETDVFCIVSSDADFAELAKEIRRDGLAAFGFGCAKTNDKYRKSCTRFFCLDADTSVVRIVGPKMHPALPIIRKALADCTASDDGWYQLGAFGKVARSAGVEPKAHGAAGLGKLLKATGQFTFNGDQRFRPVHLRAVAQDR